MGSGTDLGRTTVSAAGRLVMLVADGCPWEYGGRYNSQTAKITRAEFRIPRPGLIFKLMVLSKREENEVPFGKDEALLSPKLDQVCIDGEPHKSTGPAFAPGVMRSGNELAKSQGLLPVISFHDLNYRPGDRVAAIRCSPHAVLDEFRLRTTAR